MEIINQFKKLLFSAIILSISLPCYAANSGYYEIPEPGRPRSAFSICCCEKENESDSQTFHTCQFIDENHCPINSKLYKTAVNDCPSSLIFTKYKK